MKDGARLRGRAALKQVWQDSYDESCVLELHARVDMDGLLKEYADAILQRPTKVMKKSKVPHPMERAEAEKGVAAWKAQGYETSSVEAALSGEPAALTVAYLSLKDAIQRAEAVAETLSKLDVRGFEARAAAIREKLRDPLGHPDIDADVESLRDAIDSRHQVEARKELEAARERDSEERAKKILQMASRPETLGPEAPPSSKETVAKVLQEPSPVPDAATNLIEPFTLDNFVAGENSRFAHGAAVALVRGSDRSYNPLVVVSGPGLGKTHLLHATGNALRARSKDARVLYLSAAAFDADSRAAQAGGAPESLRSRLRNLDCLLLDDIQLLSGRPEAQAELLRLFEDLQRGGKRIVLASDRTPKAIPDLDERLVSRFESGVVASIQPPELKTRVAILAQRARAARLDVSEDVLEFIAGLVEDNVRELGGALNRVVAFSALMGRSITRDLAKEVLRDMGGALAETGPRGGTPAGALASGRSYLVEEDRPAKGFQLLGKLLEGGRAGLVITRMNPRRVRESFDVRTSRILWLTDRESKAEETIAPALERIVYEIEGFMSKKPGSVILLDGLEYLVSSNSFETVLKFVRRLVDTVSESHSIFLVSLGPATVKEQELKVLEREMEILRLE